MRSYCQNIQAVPTYSHNAHEFLSSLYSPRSSLDIILFVIITATGSFLKYATLDALMRERNKIKRLNMTSFFT